ncbi:kinase-like domain-containing protein [Trichophaea hybrida]|nr:kinase-like domain-containing protein [Trichophaea hybrida]
MPSAGWHGTTSQLENTGGGGAGDESSLRKEEVLSPIEQARRLSITFDPQVKLCGGAQMMLQEPLPKSSKTKDFSLTTEAEPCTNESGFTGLDDSSSFGLSSPPRSRRNSTIRERRRVTAAHKFLLSPAPTLNDTSDCVSSLTSDSTLISPMSEIHTPLDLERSYFGQDMIQSSLEDGVRPPSFLGTPPWPQALEKNDLPRNRSFILEPRPKSRSKRRSLGERSLNSCSNGLSPAQMFLQSFGKPAPQPQQQLEPDSEGQEVGSYVLGREIGSGGFSTVKEAITIEDGIEIKHAVKIVRKRVRDDDSENDKVQAEFDREVDLWRYLYHPNVLSLVSVFDTPFATFAFMPLYTDGNLFELMRRPENRQGLSAKRAQRYSLQLACALRYLHEDMRIVHGDVKLENCLLDMTNDAEEGGKIVLCDFGLAKFIKNPHDVDDEKDRPQKPLQKQQPEAETFCITGSLPYSAPEMIQPSTATVVDGPYSGAVDIWAFAVTVFALHTGSLPFNHALPQKLTAMITSGVWDIEKLRNCWGLVEVGKTEAEKVVQVVKGGLCTNVTRRWNIRDVLESAWLEGFGSESP